MERMKHNTIVNRFCLKDTEQYKKSTTLLLINNSRAFLKFNFAIDNDFII